VLFGHFSTIFVHNNKRIREDSFGEGTFGESFQTTQFQYLKLMTLSMFWFVLNPLEGNLKQFMGLKNVRSNWTEQCFVVIKRIVEHFRRFQHLLIVGNLLVSDVQDLFQAVKSIE